jgi:hypothetical protein
VAMKGAVGRMYLLLSACLPDNEYVLRRRVLEEITESSEYRQLLNFSFVSKIVSEKYSKAVLATLNLGELHSVQPCIPLLQTFFTTLSNCIHYGEAWKLTELDMPDMYSAASLEKALQKIQIIGTSENMTNIDETSILRIYDHSTIKDVDTFLSNFDYQQIDSLTTAIPSVIGKRLYCLNASELQDKIARAKIWLAEAKASDEAVEIDNQIFKLRKLQICFAIFCFYLLLSALFPLSTSGTVLVWGCGVVFCLVYLLRG